MTRGLYMLVALACYTAFFAAFLYLVGWIGAFDFMPTHVDKGLSAPTGTAIVIDVALIALFGLQHSIMARPKFKQGWTRFWPAPIERSFYVLATVAVLIALFAFWHPIEGAVWSVNDEVARTLIWTLFFIGWGILFIATWLLNHFELFGLQQAWLNMAGREAVPPRMRTPLLYKAVRHPIYTGFFIAFWSTPDMTYSHLLAAVGFTIYIIIGIAFEERDLLEEFGEEYRSYQRRVGAFIPGIGKKT